MSDKKKTAAAKKKAPAKKKAKVTYPFDVGDKVVYPHHGAATIVKKERIDFEGERQDYFVLEIVTDQLTLRVPAASALERGVRPVISKNKARQVFAVFKDEPLYFLLSEQSPEDVEKMKARIAAAQESGELAEIIERMKLE